MKRIISVLVLLVFFVSLFQVALAAKPETAGNDKGNKEKDKNQPLENVPEEAKGKGLAVAEEATSLKEKFEQRRLERKRLFEQLRNQADFMKFKLENVLKARKINKETLQAAKEKFLEAKSKFLESKKELDDAKKEFQDAKKAKESCTENCDDKKADLIKGTKNYLGKSADAIINHLNKVKSRIQANEDLGEEEAQEMISKIDAKIKAIEDAKAKIEIATTKEEVIEAAKVINAAWKNAKDSVDEIVNKNINSRIGGIIVKSSQLGEKLERVLARMSENGKDASSVQGLVDEFNKLIDEAKVNYEEALKLLEEAKASEENNIGEKTKATHERIMKAKDALKKANEKLKEILRELKVKGGDKELKEANGESEEEGE